MKRLGMLLLCAAACGTAVAQTVADVHAKAETSLLVAGHIIVTRDGTVGSFYLNRQEPDAVVELVKRYSSSWRFEPVLVNGTPTQVKAPMRLRLVASKDGDGYQVRVASAMFYDPRDQGDQHVTFKDHSAQPTFFERAVVQMQPTGSRRPIGIVPSVHPSGTVYMLARVERDGSVSHATAEQVNLDKVGSEPVMREMRKTLAEVSVRTLRLWTFNPPSAGPLKDADGWFIRVAISYRDYEPTEKDRPDTAWHAYIPGPEQPIPWLEEYRNTYKPDGLGVDALPGDALFTVGTGLHLLNPPDHS